MDTSRPKTSLAVGGLLVAIGLFVTYGIWHDITGQLGAWAVAEVEPARVVDVDTTAVGVRGARAYVATHTFAVSDGTCEVVSSLTFEEPARVRVARFDGEVWCAHPEASTPGFVEVFSTWSVWARTALAVVLTLVGLLLIASWFMPDDD